jgi:hypothetical protein
VARDVDPPRLHDLDRLVARLPEADAQRFDEIDLPMLTVWAIEARYPSDLADATRDDALAAISLAHAVIVAVKERLGL